CLATLPLPRSTLFPYTTLFRSAVQRVRDRNLQQFAGEPRTPSKNADWQGDPDLQLLNEFMRDELDNTVELIRLLENGGIKQVLTDRKSTRLNSSHEWISYAVFC